MLWQNDIAPNTAWSNHDISLHGSPTSPWVAAAVAVDAGPWHWCTSFSREHFRWKVVAEVRAAWKNSSATARWPELCRLLICCYPRQCQYDIVCSLTNPFPANRDTENFAWHNFVPHGYCCRLCCETQEQVYNCLWLQNRWKHNGRYSKSE